MGFTRFVVYDGSLDTFKSQKSLWNGHTLNSDLILPLSLQNEHSMFDAIKQLCSLKLAEFPESLARDNELLADQSLTFNQRNCIIERAGEKRVLLTLIEFCNFAQALLIIPKDEAKKQVSKLPAALIKTKGYFTDVLLPNWKS